MLVSKLFRKDQGMAGERRTCELLRLFVRGSTVLMAMNDPNVCHRGDKSLLGDTLWVRMVPGPPS